MGAGMERLNVKWAAGVEEVGLDILLLLLCSSFLTLTPILGGAGGGRGRAGHPGQAHPGRVCVLQQEVLTGEVPHPGLATQPQWVSSQL